MPEPKPKRRDARMADRRRVLDQRLSLAQTDGDRVWAAMDYLRGTLRDADPIQARAAANNIVAVAIDAGDSLTARRYIGQPELVAVDEVPA